MKKGQLKLEMMFIGVLIFGVIFAVGLNIYSEALSSYNVEDNTDSTFGKMKTNLRAVYEYQDDMKGKIQGDDVTSDDAVDDMVKGGYSSVRVMPFQTISTAANATMILGSELGFVDPLWMGFFLTILSILVITAIIALIFRFRT